MPTSVNVEQQQKVRIAKWGANKLFGNPDKRREMSDEELIELFDLVWKNTLENPLIMAATCDAKDAYPRITEKERQFFDFGQQHRQFRLQDLNIEFVAQLKELADNQYSLTQLWKVASSDTNPKTLYVTFETVEERKRFRIIANKLGVNDEELGRKLVLDFMSKFPKAFSDQEF